MYVEFYKHVSTMNKKLKTLRKQLIKTHKAIITFLCQTRKNYNTMHKKLKSIWLMSLCVFCITAMHSCNITRKITTESSYFQKGDTTTTITTKTIESYDATKKQ